MGFLSSVGSMLGNASLSLSDATGGWSDFSSSQSKFKYQLSRAIAAEKELALNSPSWNVEGLRKAGINPILAVNGGNIGDTHMSPSPSMPSSSGGIGFNAGSKIDRDAKQSTIDANTALADKTKAEELKTLVSSLNDLQDGGSKGIEGIARMAGRSLGPDGDVFGSLAEGIGKRLGKLLGVSSITSAKDRRSDDGNVRPAPSSALDDIRRVKEQSLRRRREFDRKYKDKKFGDVPALHSWH